MATDVKNKNQKHRREEKKTEVSNVTTSSE